MSSPNDESVAKYTSATSQHIPVDSVPLPGGDLPTNNLHFRGLRANTAGTATVETIGGGAVARVLNFLQGETRYMAITKVISTTITGLEGIV